ncbi:aldo/keto reductase [Actinobacillus ureae]|nr:aldo/keto reductase [Actinobacillus ureae]SUT85477.1 aldo/keto reductase [Actinobacillus ureae]SUU42743.1 aldo/keto reductase [Actinobacillus ureae]
MPAGSGRGETYNKVLPQLVALTDKMREIGEKQNASAAQISVAYTIAKGTLPILGATKLHHVTNAVQAMNITLTADEVSELEELAEETGVDTKGAWEESMM